MARQKKVGEKKSEETTLVPFNRSLHLLSENPEHHPSTIEPFCEEMHLKIPLSTRDLILSKSTPDW
jgi:hypothetical protein